MVSFTTAIKNFYLKAFKFKGRATRAEFWWVELYNILAIALLVYISTLKDSLIVLLLIFGKMIFLQRYTDERLLLSMEWRK